MKKARVLALMLCLLALPALAQAVSYVEYSSNGSVLTAAEKTVDNPVAITAENTEWGDGAWYIVQGQVTIDSRAAVNGTANLILEDGANLTVNGGICLEAGNTLNIYAPADSSGTGVLNAVSTDTREAGIGGDSHKEFGTLNIHGGSVAAAGKGGEDGGGNMLGSSGIGSGYNAKNLAGTVNIYGGSVTADGYAGGAGIGGSQKSLGLSAVNIYGGRVTARGHEASDRGINYSGPGIGRGMLSGNSSSTLVTISGGTVIAIGGRGAAGIGGAVGNSYNSDGGHGRAGVNVVITGGNVRATGWMAIGAGEGGYFYGTLKDGNGRNVSLYTITLDGAQADTPVSALLPEGFAYGIHDVKTLDTNKLYVYLPQGKKPAGITAGGQSYICLRQNGLYCTAHSMQPANCVSASRCEHCGAEEGKPNPDNHTYNWAYHASGAMLTLSCECGKLSEALTLNAPDNLLYDAGIKEATLQSTADAIPGVILPQIEYSCCPDGCVNAGVHTAAVTLGGKTAQLSYTIERAEPTQAHFTFTPPGSLSYDGAAKEAGIAPADGVKGMGDMTLVYYDAQGTRLSGAPVEAGAYTVKIDVDQGLNYKAAEGLGEWTFTIDRSQAELESALSVKNGDTQTRAFTFGDTITVTVVPKPKRQTFGLMRMTAQQQDDDTMALYLDDQQLCEPVKKGEDGAYTAQIPTAACKLIGSLTLTARFSGDRNMTGGSMPFDVSIAKKPLTVTEAEASSRLYEWKNKTVEITGLTVTGIETDAPDVFVDFSSGISGTLSSDAPGDYTSVTLDGLELTGGDAEYYTIEGTHRAATQVSIRSLPKTGDASSMALWLMITGMASAGLILLRRRRHG